MQDMLVRLYDLPSSEPAVAELRSQGVVCKRAESFERRHVVEFVRERFPHWVDEAESAFNHSPSTCYVASLQGKVMGFACYNVTRPDFFGPTGVDNQQRGRGVGRALLLLCLEALRAEGYGYAIIGGVGRAAAFYEKAVGATLIPGSDPGIYKDWIDA